MVSLKTYGLKRGCHKKSELEFLLSSMKKVLRDDRANTQMTLGTLLKSLGDMRDHDLVEGLKNSHSYRGYYEDLAFEPAGEAMNVCDLIVICRSAMGKTFEGYKGGEYKMDETTPVWIAERGESGKKLIAINPDGSLETRNDD